MRGSKGPWPALVALAAASLCHAGPSLIPILSEAIPGVVGPPPGTYAGAQVLMPASLSAGAVMQYRFSGQDAWRAFDRPLSLSAFAGEERRYVIEVRHSGAVKAASLSYVIDMRAPEPPMFSLPSGDAGARLVIALEGSDSLYLSVDGSPFEPFSATDRRVIDAPADGTRIVRATAYAADAAGNASRSVSARWRLYPDGFAPSFPPPGLTDVNARTVSMAGEGLSAELVDLVGSALLSVRVPPGTVPYAAVNAADPLSSAYSYVALSGEQPSASCVIPFPWGYDEALTVHYGYLKEGSLYVSPEPLRLSPRYPSDQAAGAPATSVAPAVRIDGEAAVLEWPASPWTVLFAVGTPEFKVYKEPVRVVLGSHPLTVSYFSLGQNGEKSAMSSVELPTGPLPAYPAIEGVRQGGRYGPVAVALPVGESAILYELSEGQNPPRAIGEDSPALGAAGLRFEGRAGEVVGYSLRLATTGLIPGRPSADPVERLVSFSVDRQAPPVPEVEPGTRGYSSQDSVLAFKPSPGEVFVSVSEDGSAPFRRYEGPTAIQGSEEGRRRYVVRAYAEDEFGNRSEEMRSLVLLIDRASLYSDARGRPGASGAPDDPIPYLDDAIEAATATGKRFIYVRGTVALRRPVSVQTRIRIAGGFDVEWNEAPAQRAGVVVGRLEGASPFAFIVDGGALEFSAVDVAMSGEGAGGLILGRSGSVRLTNSTVRLSGGVEKTAIRSTGAAVDVVSSTIGLYSVVTGRAIDHTGSLLSVSDSTVSCDASVRLFDAVRVSDAEAGFRGFRLDAAPAQALAAISATRSTIAVERSVLILSGGSSSCRVFSASGSRVTASSTFIDAAWRGPFEAFSASNGSELRLAHLTVRAVAPSSLFAGLAASTMELVNTIASFPGSEAVFIRSDSSLQAGSVQANCLWGFTTILEGAVASGTAASGASALARFNGMIRAARPNIIEEPVKIFSGTVKGLPRLSAASTCVDGGILATWAGKLDLFGADRLKGRAPDIGAEEL